MTGRSRALGGASVCAVGLGCMNLSHAYGAPPPPEVGRRVIEAALDLGVVHFDSAALYGFGRNEDLIGGVLGSRRRDVFLTSKCGMTGVDGKRVIDGRPETLRRTLDESLRRLRTDWIDLYYLHRVDRNVPVEESIGELARMVERGKVRAIGLSETSAPTLRRAHSIHPVSAVQSEYSPWSRNADIAVIEACAEIGAAFVAFSPLARGFLTDVDVRPQDFVERDVRCAMPRFQSPNFERNAALLPGFRALAAEAGCTAAQLTLAWALDRAPHVHVIPGTTKIEHLTENFAAADLKLAAGMRARIDAMINDSAISGARYNDATLAEIDTEAFA